MRVLEQLEPQGVFRFFEELCAIPHGSRNCQAVSDWCAAFARERGLECHQDQAGNVIIIQEATPGYEAAAPVILQGHLDMVCEKEPGCTKDMAGEGLDLLVEDGLLTKQEVKAYRWGSDPRHVDYGAVYNSRLKLLSKAKKRGWERDREEVTAFVAENARWLPDYALFMACKRHFGMRSWTEWEDEDIRLRRSQLVLEQYRTLLREDVELFTYIQYLFFRQWEALRTYLHGKDIHIIGDLPIYVAMDSADVWAEPENFQLDDRCVPTEVSGVPPDYFSADGQLWGNPLYRWDRMQADGFGWWIRRIDGAGKLYDVIRIDHFRGFESYWAVPYGETTAKNGRWVKGPGMALVGVLTGWFPQLEFIAEDLGYPTPEVAQLLRDSLSLIHI